MLEGVTPFPKDFAERYVARGYWEESPLIDGLREAFSRYADRVAIIDLDETLTYRELDRRSSLLARHLLDLGLRPLDREVVQLPNTALFACLYVAMQKVGVIPILALPVHRRWEVSQFVERGLYVSASSCWARLRRMYVSAMTTDL